MTKNTLLGLLAFAMMAFKVKAQHQTYYWDGQFLSENAKFEQAQHSLESNGYRLELEALDSGRLLLQVEDLREFAQIFKKCRSQIEFQAEDGSSLRLSKRKIHRQIRKQFEEESYGTSLSRKTVRKLLKGKNSRRFRRNAVNFFLDFGAVDSRNGEIFTFNFSQGRNSIFQIVFMPLLVQSAEELPHLRHSYCKPFARLTEFKGYFNSKYKNFPSTPFALPKALKRTRTFRLTFEKNKTSLAPDDELLIRQFLEDSTYRIKKARIKAWASIEGDAELNEKLHQKRAGQLIQMLSAYNEEEIPYSTHTEENWPLFYRQLQAQKIDTCGISKEEWKKTVAGDSLKWEPLLQKQRKAELKLYVLIKLDNSMRQQIALDRLQRLQKNYPLSKQSQALGQEMLPVFAFLEKEVLEEKFSAEVFNTLLKSNLPYALRMQWFYSQVERAEKGETLTEPLEKQAVELYQYIESHYFSKPEHKDYHHDLLIVQSLIYDKILNREFSSDLLCKIPVSEHYQSRSAFLNYLRYLNQSESLFGKASACPEACKETTVWQSVSGDRRYYYMLKKRILEEIRIKEALRSDWLFEFDLYEFLYLNIQAWEPKIERFHDQEIKVKEIDRLLDNLLKNMERLCPDQAHHLAVKFYAKVIHHSLLPGKTDQMMLRKAAGYIEKHYSTYSYMLSEQEAELVARQLLIANHKFFRNEGKTFELKLREKVYSITN